MYLRLETSFQICCSRRDQSDDSCIQSIRSSNTRLETFWSYWMSTHLKQHWKQLRRWQVFLQNNRKSTLRLSIWKPGFKSSSKESRDSKQLYYLSKLSQTLSKIYRRRSKHPSFTVSNTWSTNLLICSGRLTNRHLSLINKRGRYLVFNTKRKFYPIPFAKKKKIWTRFKSRFLSLKLSTTNICPNTTSKYLCCRFRTKS